MFTLQSEQQHAVAFDLRQITSKDNRSTVAPDRPVPTLNADSGMHVAFAQNQRGEVRDLNDVSGSVAAEPGMNQQTYVAHTLRAEGHDASEDGTGRGTPLVAHHMAVRRLTPTECARLQGFPDDHLDLDPPLSDSAKYRLLGNAVAVPVAAWIGQRIVEATT